MKQLFPNFIQAGSPSALRSLMAQVSLKAGGTVNFFSVYYDTAAKLHTAWYHDTVENITASEMAAIKGKSDAGRRKD